MTRTILILLALLLAGSASGQGADYRIQTGDISAPLWRYAPVVTDSTYTLCGDSIPVLIHGIDYYQFHLVPFRYYPVWIFIDPYVDTLRFNPRWLGLEPDVLVVSASGWVMPYFAGRVVTNNGVAWIAADAAIDGTLNGLPDYWEYDLNADGFITLSDLTFFGQDYGLRGKQLWTLSDFTAFGQIYNARR